MRSTMKISSNVMLNNILNNYSRLFSVQNQMATRQRVNAPSDDPLATNVGLRMGTVISRITQYNRNIVSGNSFLALSDGTLSNMHKILNSAKALTISSASETTTHEMRQANVIEIQSTLSSIVNLANAAEAGRYLFGGTLSTEPPYEVIGSRYVYYKGNENSIKIQSDAASYMKINTTGNEVFGSMTSTTTSRDLSPQITMGPSFATRLEDLNGGIGVPKGSINIKYSAYPTNGLNVDLSGCDTVEDVARAIEEATRAASAELDPKGTAGAPISYMAKRYVKVEVNPDGTGISLRETDPVWEATANRPDKRPPDYPGFTNPSRLEVTEVSGGMVAARLGIKGVSNYNIDPLNVQQVIPTPLVGSDLNPRVTPNTLLSDLKDYVDKPFTITNGPLPSKVGLIEINDTFNSYTNWNLNGLDKGDNTDKDGELYIRTEEKVPGSNEYYLRIYKGSGGLARDLVAESNAPINDHTVSPPLAGGTVVFKEANSSGITGTVNMPSVRLPVAPVALQAQFDDTFSATISVPSFLQDMADLTYHDVMSDFRMRGMQRGNDPQNKGANTCGIDGKFAVEVVNNYAFRISGDDSRQVNGVSLDTSTLSKTGSASANPDTDAKGNIYLRVLGGGIVEAYNTADYSGPVVATGTWPGGGGSFALTPNPGYNLSGTIDVTGAPPVGENFTISVEPQVTVNVYNSSASPRSLIANGTLPQGLEKGNVALVGTENFSDLCGSVYVDWTRNYDPATGFEYQDAFGTPDSNIKYDMTATFATVEDLLNAVNSSNTYTSASISKDGNGINIVSHLAGAHMIVTESVERVNHFNDYGQLGEVNLTSVIKGFNTNHEGRIFSNITTEQGHTVNIPAVGDCITYNTTVSLYNEDPRDTAFDLETSLVGNASTQAAYDAATGTWYQLDVINNVWNAVPDYPAGETLTINQSNNSGLAGTLKLNSVRIPRMPYTETTYFNPEAPAGQKYLENAIVLDTNSRVLNDSVSATGDDFNYVQNVSITNAQPGLNTNKDGNLNVTTGFTILNDQAGQVCKPDLSGIIDGANTDASGRLYAVTSYAVENDDLNQMHQLQVSGFTRKKETDVDGKLYVEIDAGTNEVRIYNNSDPLVRQHVATGTLNPGGTTTFLPEAGYSLRGSFVMPAGVPTTDTDIVIDLTKGSLMVYNNATLDPASLVASGNSDSTGNVTLNEIGGSGITGSARFPTPDGRHEITFDRDIIIDTRQREVVVYSDDNYSSRVAKGSFAQFAGGEIPLTALNSSALGGTLSFNSVVGGTDTQNQIQNLNLQGIRLGSNTSIDGMVYIEIVNDPINGWTTNVYNSNDPGGIPIATGTIDMETGNVTLSEAGGSGVSGTLKVANPPSWYPVEQSAAAGLIAVDVAGQQPDILITPPRGLQNSGENREDNIFTTLNDVMDAMRNDDVEKLHDLLAVFERDHNLILSARANIGTRIDRLALLTSRHEDEIINFTKIRSEYIDLDYSKAIVEYQAAQNVFDAALRTTAQLIPMSLLDFI